MEKQQFDAVLEALKDIKVNVSLIYWAVMLIFFWHACSGGAA